MAKPSTLLASLNRVPGHVAAMFVLSCSIAIAAYYADAPGFSLLDEAYVGLLSFGALLGALVLAAKWVMSRRKLQRVKKPFRKLEEEQQHYLLGIRATGRSWFMGYAEDQPWFKDLVAFGYVEIARPFILVHGEPSIYQLTAHGSRALDHAAKMSR